MSQFVCSGAVLTCTFGTAPSSLVATQTPGVMLEGKPVATLTDAAPMVNIAPFGLCTSLANPTVAAATAAALGVLTPQPCIPATASWLPTGTPVFAGGKPCMTQDCKCVCSYLGQISVINPGQIMVGSN